MTKKKIILLLLAVVSLLLCACTGKTQAKDTDSASAGLQDTNSPKAAADSVMNSLKTLDLNTFNEYTDNYICTHRNWIGVPTSREYQIFNELLQPALMKGKHYKRNYNLSQKFTQNLSWEITDIRESEETAEIDMNITNIDMDAAMGKYITFILENMAESEGLGMISLIRDLFDLSGNMDDLLSIIDSMDAENVRTTGVTLSAWLDNGKWKIHLNDEFINAFMGSFGSEELSPENMEKMEMLEKKMENKADKWAEEFEEKIEGLFD